MVRTERVEPGSVKPGVHIAVLEWIFAVLIILAFLLAVSAVLVRSTDPPSPSPTGQIGTAISAVNPNAEGWATHCEPTPDHCQSWGNGAMVGAVPTFHYGDEPYTQHLCGAGRGVITCIDVLVVSNCACGDRHGIPTIIDLSPAAFDKIADLSRGIVHVRFGDAPWPTPHPDPTGTLPPTDVE